MDRKQFPRAERFYRAALRLYIETQGPEHVNVGIVEEKLGDALLRQFRYREAEEQTLAGYRILARLPSREVFSGWGGGCRQCVRSGGQEVSGGAIF